MPKGMYAVIDGSAKKIKKQYAVINGVAKKIKKMYAVVNGAARPMYDGGHNLLPLYKGVIACGYYDADSGKRFRFIKRDRSADNSLNPASEICSIDNRSSFAYCASGTLDGKYVAYLNKYSQTIIIKRYDKASNSYMEYSSFDLSGFLVSQYGYANIYYVSISNGSPFPIFFSNDGRIAIPFYRSDLLTGTARMRTVSILFLKDNGSSFLFDRIIDIPHDMPSDSFTIRSLSCVLNDDFTVAAFVIRSNGNTSSYQCESSSIYSISSSYELTELANHSDCSAGSTTEYSEGSGVCSMTRDGEYIVLSRPAYTQTYPANNKYYSIYHISGKTATLLKTSSSYLRYFGENIFKSKDGKNLYIAENIGSSAYSPYLYSYSINSDRTLTELGRTAYYYRYFDELEDGSYALVSHQKYPENQPFDFQLYYAVPSKNANGQLTGFSIKADLGSLDYMAYFVDDSNEKE